MKPVLVTGLTGFLGVNFLRCLLDDRPDVTVRGLVRNTGQSGSLISDSVEVVQGDVTDPASLMGKFHGFRTVIHLASKIAASDLAEYRRVNVEGTRNVAERCEREGVEHIIYVSSAAIYGFKDARGTEEHEPRDLPATPVSRSRYEAEQVLMEYHRQQRFKVSILRPLFVYGEGDRFFIPAILRTLRYFPFIVNRGRARFSVISAKELGGVILELVKTDLPATDYPVYHATDGVPVSLEEVVHTLCEELGLKYPSVSVPYRLAVLAMIIGGAKHLFIGQNGSNFSGAVRNVSNVELRHRIHLVSHDHYYSNRRLTMDLPRVGLSTFAAQIRSFIPYYRSVLSVMNP